MRLRPTPRRDEHESSSWGGAALPNPPGRARPSRGRGYAGTRFPYFDVSGITPDIERCLDEDGRAGQGPGIGGGRPAAE